MGNRFTRVCVKGIDENENGSLGGWERELLTLARFLKAKICEDVVCEGKNTDVLITTLETDFPKVQDFCKKVYHVFHIWGKIPNETDLVLTDTQRGKQIYEAQGFKTVVMYPPIKPVYIKEQRIRNKILFVGSIHVGKRPDLAISAMDLLSDYTLDVVGSTYKTTEAGIEGMYIADYPQFCKDICGSNVNWLGELRYNEVMKKMQTSEMIIIPYCSDNEFNTNVALEAISNGCVPIIAEGLTDYLTDEAVILPNQRDLTPKIIADRISMLSEEEIEIRREKCYSKAEEIYRYCATEMKEKICEI